MVNIWLMHNLYTKNIICSSIPKKSVHHIIFHHVVIWKNISGVIHPDDRIKGMPILFHMGSDGQIGSCPTLLRVGKILRHFFKWLGWCWAISSLSLRQAPRHEEVLQRRESRTNSPTPQSSLVLCRAENAPTTSFSCGFYTATHWKLLVD